MIFILHKNVFEEFIALIINKIEASSNISTHFYISFCYEVWRVTNADERVDEF